ncbi:hypothetical protein [Helicobacter bilis]|uniref:hypothetical protein n=1 Tax=Helicobacter bilis TaxID=37372 RepID=UPI000ACC1CB5|nr:hypothetical protein [Helicobacter bilis]MCI7411558.1 hypothetical protein [Helicobacter bilis]MDD7297687.1 hypothetical protein [Helicobacter bilis]MDY4400098.1 hypothetical protein [Helicobacter bilis]
MYRFLAYQSSYLESFIAELFKESLIHRFKEYEINKVSKRKLISNHTIQYGIHNGM